MCTQPVWIGDQLLKSGWVRDLDDIRLQAALCSLWLLEVCLTGVSDDKQQKCASAEVGMAMLQLSGSSVFNTLRSTCFSTQQA
mmetsp:Transcript_9960/g.17441  ORF Transcript_9960/g.17441 Transcript_9960/m.17441 type:complete len:83 (+) Transcript_9960:44-292(+)